MADKPKGYTKHWDVFKQVTEDLAVQCRRCRKTWTETVTHYGVFAGFARYYDYCSECITPEDKSE